MDTRNDIREFLISRRAKVTPEQAGLPAYGNRRRVSGLRREEVAILRAEAGRDPHDRRLSDLIGELSTRSEEFRVRWAAHNVKFHRTGVKRYHHPLVGDLTLTYEALELPADTGQKMLVYTAEPGSPSHEALNLLASWTSTPAEAATVQAEEE